MRCNTLKRKNKSLKSFLFRFDAIESLWILDPRLRGDDKKMEEITKEKPDDANCGSLVSKLLPSPSVNINCAAHLIVADAG
jgi:hypothetical protein